MRLASRLLLTVVAMVPAVAGIMVLGAGRSVAGARPLGAGDKAWTKTYATPAPCSKATPTTAAGFDQLFRSLPTGQWGAADVGISVPMGNGRSVWLWGDTLSTGGRFVHSSAITQDRGCLHVSRAGAQVLPNDGARYYWIEAASNLGSGYLSIRAEEIVTEAAAEWGFRYTGFNRVAKVRVTSAGDLVFVGWTARYAAPLAAQVGDLVLLPSGQIEYSHRRHPEFKLASGRVLESAARNWVDGKLHPLDTYRPVFREVR